MIVAYLDPGAGSLVIQAIIAGALAVPFLLRQQIGSLVRRFRSRDMPPDADVDRA
jgi:hypothetical protein